ncbi:MAG: dihydrofolate reductase family protein [Nocardioidaceae bacterium]
MGRVVLQAGTSVDGLVVYPRGEEHEQMVEWKVRSVGEASVHVMGRVTYEEMAAHWPTSSSPFAAPMNDVPKVVFSSTLERAEWPESRIARGPLAEEIAALREEVGDGIVLVHGGPSFARAVTGEGMVDEYRVVVWPVIAGDREGVRWFGDLAEPQSLQVVSSADFPDGSGVRVYRPS